MADNRRISEEYTEIGNTLIQSEKELAYIRESNAEIVFLASTQAKKKADKIVLGQCEKVADKYKWGIPCDFTITVFEPNVEGFTAKQLEILLFHELLHVGIEDAGTEDERHFIRPHDLEDFKVIIDMYGTEWADVDKEQL